MYEIDVCCAQLLFRFKQSNDKHLVELLLIEELKIYDDKDKMYKMISNIICQKTKTKKWYIVKVFPGIKIQLKIQKMKFNNFIK